MAKFSLPFHTPLAGLKFLSFLINLLQLYYISSSCCFFLVSQYNLQFPQVYGKFFPWERMRANITNKVRCISGNSKSAVVRFASLPVGRYIFFL